MKIILLDHDEESEYLIPSDGAYGSTEPNSRTGENRTKEVRIAIGPNGSRRGHNNPMTLEHNVACSPCAVR